METGLTDAGCGQSDERSDLRHFKEVFHIAHGTAESYSPLALAYIGDSVFDIMIRTIAVSRVNQQVNKYHREVSRIVCAPAQAKMIQAIMDELTPEEKAIYRRGRNADSYTKAKNASRSEYRKATGFEAVLGYLYLKEDFHRLTEVVHMGLQTLDDREARQEG